MRRPLKPHQIRKLKTIDFEKVADTLLSETHRGQAHVDIFEGLTKVDPYILNHTPMFFQYTIWGHQYAATMYATKLFDTHGDANTVPKFLEMAKIRAKGFPKKFETEVLRLVKEGEERIAKLRPTIKILARRRNYIYAHISEQLVLQTTQKTVLTIEQLREVLVEAAGVESESSARF